MNRHFELVFCMSSAQARLISPLIALQVFEQHLMAGCLIVLAARGIVKWLDVAAMGGLNYQMVIKRS